MRFPRFLSETFARFCVHGNRSFCVEKMSQITVDPRENTGVYTIKMAESEMELDGTRASRKLDSYSSRADLVSEGEDTANAAAMRERKTTLYRMLYIDLPLFLAVLVVASLIEFGVIPSFSTGYFCNDPKLSMKYQGDTVSFKLLLAMTLFLPAVFIWLSELYLHRPGDYSKTTSRASVTFYRSLHWYREYLYGVALQLAMVEGMKVMIGEPRPHFFDSCKPNVQCNGSVYVTDYKCENKDVSKWLLIDSARSFPSGHSSLSFHLALFMAWYIQARLMSPSRRQGFFLPFLQVILVIIAACIALSRISDNRHHWWDVLVGTCIGVGSVIYTVIVLCGSFRLYEAPSCSSDSISDSSTAGRATRDRLIAERAECTTPPHAAA